MHVSKRIISGDPKGAIGNTYETLCGGTVVETEAPGPFVDWAGWRALCDVKSRAAWQPWVKEVFSLVKRLAGDAYEDAKAKRLGGRR